MTPEQFEALVEALERIQLDLWAISIALQAIAGATAGIMVGVALWARGRR